MVNYESLLRLLFCIVEQNIDFKKFFKKTFKYSSFHFLKIFYAKDEKFCVMNFFGQFLDINDQ